MIEDQADVHETKDATVMAGETAPPQPVKVCVQCGVNLSGKQRKKDAQGYWCLECAGTKTKTLAAPAAPTCADCRRTGLDIPFVSIEGRLLCDLCAAAAGHQIEHGTQVAVDTSLGDSNAPPAPESESGIAGGKICVGCGMNLSGKTRLKDEKGYWCVDCDKKERAKPVKVVCAGCGRTVSRTDVIKFKGKRLCDLCAEGKQADAGSPDDTDTMEAIVEKLCNACGKDVSRIKRWKDQKGYWCDECHQKEAKVKESPKPAVPKQLRCLECGNMVASETLTKVDGLEICRLCVDRRAQESRLKKEVAGKRGGIGSTFRFLQKDADSSRRKKMIAGILIAAVLTFASLYANGFFTHPQ
jgi:formylmethanofuran dehydrogenase subunit E